MVALPTNLTHRDYTAEKKQRIKAGAAKVKAAKKEHPENFQATDKSTRYYTKGATSDMIPPPSHLLNGVKEASALEHPIKAEVVALPTKLTHRDYTAEKKQRIKAGAAKVKAAKKEHPENHQATDKSTRYYTKGAKSDMISPPSNLLHKKEQATIKVPVHEGIPIRKVPSPVALKLRAAHFEHHLEQV